MPLLIHRDGSDKGHLVFGSTSRLGAGSFPAQVGVIGLYEALQRVESLAFQHGLHELVMDAPGRGVTHDKLATQRQSGQPGFRLADQVNRHKPEDQRQTRYLKESSGNQRSVKAIMASLKGLERAAFQNRMPGTTTLGAMKSVWSTHRFQDHCAVPGSKTL